MLKTFANLGVTVSFLLIFSTLVCAFWIRSQPSVEKSSITFHANLGMSTMTILTITLVLQMMVIRQLGAR